MATDRADIGKSGDEFNFIEEVLAVVDSIPPGLVATYGDVAALVGSRGARVVGGIMKKYGHDHPWWRVVGAGGRPPQGHELRAREHYLDEGTPLLETAAFPGYRVHYAVARWIPHHTSLITTNDPENT